MGVSLWETATCLGPNETSWFVGVQSSIYDQTTGLIIETLEANLADGEPDISILAQSYSLARGGTFHTLSVDVLNQSSQSLSSFGNLVMLLDASGDPLFTGYLYDDSSFDGVFSPGETGVLSSSSFYYNGTCSSLRVFMDVNYSSSAAIAAAGELRQKLGQGELSQDQYMKSMHDLREAAIEQQRNQLQ